MQGNAGEIKRQHTAEKIKQPSTMQTRSENTT